MADTPEVDLSDKECDDTPVDSGNWVVLGPDDHEAIADVIRSVRVGFPEPNEGNDDCNEKPGITLLVVEAAAKRFITKKEELDDGLVRVDQISQDLYRVTLPFGRYSMSGGGCQICIDASEMAETDLFFNLFFMLGYDDVVRVNALHSGEKWQNEHFTEAGNSKE